MAAARGEMRTDPRLRKVKRYFAGKVPHWVRDYYYDYVSGEYIVEVDAQACREGQDHRRPAPQPAPLCRARPASEIVLPDEMVIRSQMMQVDDNACEDEDEEEEAAAAALEDERRKRIRERQLPLLEQEEDLLPLEPEEDHVAAVGAAESEYETASEEEEDEQTAAVPMPPPPPVAVGFVPKSQRSTERLKDEKWVEELANQRRLLDTRRILVQAIRPSQELVHQTVADDTVRTSADGDDETDEAAVEYESWKRRELARTNKRAHSPDPDAAPPRSKKYVCRYYDKGRCFFQDNPDDATQTANGACDDSAAISLLRRSDKIR